jgi:hypothetical protein
MAVNPEVALGACKYNDAGITMFAGSAIFIALNCLENRFSIAPVHAGDDLGKILW